MATLSIKSLWNNGSLYLITLMLEGNCETEEKEEEGDGL